MSLVWTDIADIVIALDEAHPEADPQTVRFTDLYTWVLELPDFSGDPQRAGEKVLEAIQAAWIAERQ